MSHIKKTGFALLISMVITWIYIQPHNIYADISSVYDCLKADDCYENDQTVTQKESDHNNNQEDTTEVNSQSTSTPTLGSNIIKMIVSLLFIFLLIYVLSRILKKRHSFMRGSNQLESLGGITVGQNKSIQIIRVGGSFYMVGVGDNVELLKEITDEAMIQQLHDDHATSDTNAGGILQSFFANKDDKRETKQTFSEMFSTELTKLKENRQKLVDQTQQRKDTDE